MHTPTFPAAAVTRATNPIAAALVGIVRDQGLTPDDTFSGDRYVIHLDRDVRVPVPADITVTNPDMDGPSDWQFLHSGYWTLLITANGAYAWGSVFFTREKADHWAAKLREW